MLAFSKNNEKLRVEYFLNPFLSEIVMLLKGCSKYLYMVGCIYSWVPEKWLGLGLKYFIYFLFYIPLEILL